MNAAARRIVGGIIIVLGSVAGHTRAQAQAAGSAETARLKDAYLADLADLEKKFTMLAEAFPADKYAWRPMPGVRSVSAVLGLIAAENYSTLTRGFGGTVPADVPNSEEKMEALTDKAQLAKHVKTSYSLAIAAIKAWNGSPEGPINLWGEKRTLANAFMTVMADQHEHLGQLIAYARMNKIVPPWSK